MADGVAQTALCPSSSQAYPRSHQPIRASSPCAWRSAEAQGRWEPKVRAVPGKFQPQCPGMTPTMMVQAEQLQIHFWTGGAAVCAYVLMSGETPARGTKFQPQAGPGPEPAGLQCSTGSQHGCVSRSASTGEGLAG